jgi:hypothetical protein
MLSSQLRSKLYKNKHFFSQQAKVGHDTDLHALSRHSNSRYMIYHFIENHPAHSIASMATTTNDNGDIPIDEIVKNPRLDIQSKKDIITHLLDIIVQHQNLKPLTELLCVEDVLKHYPDNSNPALLENLKLACEIVNEIRSSIVFSSTHTDFNWLEKDTQREIIKRIEKIRSILKGDMNQCTIENNYSLIKRFKTANCGETSYASIHLLQQKSTKELDAQRIRLQNGDHCTMIFGTNLSINPNHYFNKNTDIVYCDAWLGKVGKFHHDDIAKNLGSTRQVLSSDKLAARIVTTFNPEFHQFSYSPFWHIHPAVKDKNHYNGLKFFEREIPAVIYIDEKKPSNHQLRS